MGASKPGPQRPCWASSVEVAGHGQWRAARQWCHIPRKVNKQRKQTNKKVFHIKFTYWEYCYFVTCGLLTAIIHAVLWCSAFLHNTPRPLRPVSPWLLTLRSRLQASARESRSLAAAHRSNPKQPEGVELPYPPSSSGSPAPLMPRRYQSIRYTSTVLWPESATTRY